MNPLKPIASIAISDKWPSDQGLRAVFPFSAGQQKAWFDMQENKQRLRLLATS